MRETSGKIIGRIGMLRREFLLLGIFSILLCSILLPVEAYFNFNQSSAEITKKIILDESRLASLVYDTINKLPQAHMLEEKNRIYSIHKPMAGHETCGICGAPQNMGFVLIVNPKLPKLESRYEVSYLALHYMKDHRKFPPASESPFRKIDLHHLLSILDLDQKYETNPPENKLAHLKGLDFELAYLVLLTSKGIKPLSRWESSLTKEQLAILSEFDLQYEVLTRVVGPDKQVKEVIFSKLPGYISIYRNTVASSHLPSSSIDSSLIARIEGFLFGYPPCCVEHFIVHGYKENKLKPDDQKILFHWADPNCKVTQHLLSFYREIYDTVSKVFNK